LMDVCVIARPPLNQALPFKAVNLSKSHLIREGDNRIYLIGLFLNA
jgi:hypothetical protein